MFYFERSVGVSSGLLPLPVHLWNRSGRTFDFQTVLNTSYSYSFKQFCNQSFFRNFKAIICIDCQLAEISNFWTPTRAIVGQNLCILEKGKYWRSTPGDNYETSVLQLWRGKFRKVHPTEVPSRSEIIILSANFTPRQQPHSLARTLFVRIYFPAECMKLTKTVCHNGGKRITSRESIRCNPLRCKSYFERFSTTSVMRKLFNFYQYQ